MAEKVSMRDRPLVSMAMTTYNRKEYIREALAGLFAQTYDPLEIVISDDCSTDGTWEIINEEVGKYRAAGGGRTVVLHRNEKNLRVLRNFEKLVSLCHGDLIVQCGDDDVSFPIRAERTVKQWLAAGGKDKIKLIHCGAERVDLQGKRMREGLYGRDAFSPVGAAAAYSRDVFTSWGAIANQNVYEDVVYSFRAALLGDDLTIADELLKYRYGSGSTSSCEDFRSAHIKVLMRIIESFDENEAELNAHKSMLSQEHFAHLLEKNKTARENACRSLQLLQGSTMWRRFGSRRRIGYAWIGNVLKGHLGALVHPLFTALCIMPKWFGTPLLNRYVRLLYRMRLPVYTCE